MVRVSDSVTGIEKQYMCEINRVYVFFEVVFYIEF